MADLDDPARIAAALDETTAERLEDMRVPAVPAPSASADAAALARDIDIIEREIVELGPTTAENLAVLCRADNLYQVEQDFLTQQRRKK